MAAKTVSNFNEQTKINSPKQPTPVLIKPVLTMLRHLTLIPIPKFTSNSWKHPEDFPKAHQKRDCNSNFSPDINFGRLRHDLLELADFCQTLLMWVAIAINYGYCRKDGGGIVKWHLSPGTAFYRGSPSRYETGTNQMFV